MPSTIGIVLLDENPGAGASASKGTGDCQPAWQLSSPSHWTARVNAAIARGANVESMVAGTQAAIDVVVETARSLDGQADLIIGNCGFFWPAGQQLTGSTFTPTFLSGLDFLELALRSTARSIGIVSYDAQALTGMLREHPQRQRIVAVGLNDLPDWAAIGADGFLDRGGWTMTGLRRQLVGRLAMAFQADGSLATCSLLILECTVLSEFRADIRAMTNLPIIDIATMASAMLR